MITSMTRQERYRKIATACEDVADTYDEWGTRPERVMRRLWLGWARYYRFMARHSR